MNKADIINSVRLKRLDRKEDKLLCTLLVEDVLETIREFLQAGHNVTIANFGSFKCNSMKSRKARNPKTGAWVELPLHIKITFKPAPFLKKGIKA